MPIRVFPVAAEGGPHFVNDFGQVQPLPAKRHDGIDIFADRGTPIVAVDDGALRFAEDPLGGHAFYLAADDRTTYYGAHLDSYEGAARRVQAGEIIGYVGQSGNAASTSPHLHFEVHPSGGVAVNPFPALSGLTPPSVTSSLGAVDQVLPPSVSPAGDLPPIAVVPGPVPDFPSSGKRNGGAAALSFLGLVFGVGAIVRGRSRRRGF